MKQKEEKYMYTPNTITRHCSINCIILNNKLLCILQKQPLITPTSQLHSSFWTAPVHLLHKQKLLQLVQYFCSIYVN